MNTGTPGRRVMAVATLLILSAITGVVSYEHGLDVVRSVGNTGLVAYLVPFVPDIMVVAASMALLEAGSLGVRRPLAAVGALVVGIGWTVAANVVAGVHGGVGGALIAAGIPVAFLLVLETLLWMYRHARAEYTVPVTVPQYVMDVLEARAALMHAEYAVSASYAAVVAAESVLRASVPVVIPEPASEVRVPEPDSQFTAPWETLLHALPDFDIPVPGMNLTADDYELPGYKVPFASPPAVSTSTDSGYTGDSDGYTDGSELLDLMDEFRAEIHAGTVPTIREIRARKHVGQPKATEYQRLIESVMAKAALGRAV